MQNQKPPRPSAQLRLTVRVAKLYHEGGMKQTEVAEQLGISQTRVSRLLRKAEKLGMVRHTVTPPPGINVDLETGLEKQYGLREVIVVDAPTSPEFLYSALGVAGAEFMQTELTEQDRVGLSSWSASLLASIEALDPNQAPPVKEIVQLVGGVGVQAVQNRANRILGRFAAMTRAVPHYLMAPGLLDSGTAVQALLGDSSFREVVTAWQRVTVAIVGIGAPEPSPFYRASGHAIGRDEFLELTAAGAVGDILLRYLNIEGDLIDTDLNDRVVGIPLSTFRNIPIRVAIAGGPKKVSATRAVLNGGWITTLITDADTAMALLEDR